MTQTTKIISLLFSFDTFNLLNLFFLIFLPFPQILHLLLICRYTITFHPITSDVCTIACGLSLPLSQSYICLVYH